LIERIEANQLTSEDQRVRVKLIEVYFWLTAALRESKLSLKRLKKRLFGEGAKPRKPEEGDEPAPSAPDEARPTAEAEAPGAAPESPPRGHGRQAAAEYTGATVVTCRHDTLSVGERSPRQGEAGRAGEGSFTACRPA
jgi:hypothetical protein